MFWVTAQPTDKSMKTWFATKLIKGEPFSKWIGRGLIPFPSQSEIVLPFEERLGYILNRLGGILRLYLAV